MTMFKLLEYIFNRIGHLGCFVTIIDIKSGQMVLKVWNKARYGVVSITEELLNDLCDSTNEKRNEMIDTILLLSALKER